MLERRPSQTTLRMYKHLLHWELNAPSYTKFDEGAPVFLSGISFHECDIVLLTYYSGLRLLHISACVSALDCFSQELKFAELDSVALSTTRAILFEVE